MMATRASVCHLLFRPHLSLSQAECASERLSIYHHLSAGGGHGGEEAVCHQPCPLLPQDASLLILLSRESAQAGAAGAHPCGGSLLLLEDLIRQQSRVSSHGTAPLGMSRFMSASECHCPPVSPNVSLPITRGIVRSFVRLFIHSFISYVHKKMLSRAHHGHACLLRMRGRGNAANFTVRSLHQANQCSPLRLATHRDVSMLVLVLRLESEMSPTVMTLHRDIYGAMWKWGPWTRMQSSWLLPQHPACSCAATVPAAIMD